MSPPPRLLLLPLLLVIGAAGRPVRKVEMGSALNGEAEVAARRCAVCEYVVDSLDKRIRSDFREGKTIEVGWRMDGAGGRSRRRIAAGLSESGFLEHLEATCSPRTMLPSLLYEREGALRLVDAGISGPDHPDFEHTLVKKDREVAEKWMAVCNWFIQEYDEALSDHVRHWNRGKMKTENEAGEQVDDFVNLDGGTATMIWNMCHQETKLCPSKRWGPKLEVAFHQQHARQRRNFLKRDDPFPEL